jgi:hypothetical protein
MVNHELFPGLSSPQDHIRNEEGESSMAANFVRQKYELAIRHRKTIESRWLKAFNQFRGNYSQEEIEALNAIKAINPRASEAFIKVTKTKTLAAYGSIIEVVASNGRLPISVEATPEPEGIAKEVFKVSEDNTLYDDHASAIGYKGDGKEIDPGSTFRDLFSGLGKKYEKLFQGGKPISGKSPDQNAMPSVHPSRESAERMDSVIQDQLLELDALSKLQGCLWEVVVFGTGILKGPFTFKEVTPHWSYDPEVDEAPVFEPRVKLRPYIENPSIWDVYPDPYANTQEELDFVVERHKMTKDQLLRLKNQTGFDNKAIDKAAQHLGVGIVSDGGWEQTLRDGVAQSDDTRHEVLEFWGNVPFKDAKEWGIKDLPKGLEDHEMVSVRMWTCYGNCLFKAINPFIPDYIPYYFPVYEEQRYSLWGIGVPENMEDTQRMINVHTRAAQDNLRLAGSLMLEVNESQLAPGQDGNIYDGKVWRKQGGAPGQSIYPISFKSTANEHLMFIREANGWADVATGIPSVLHGVGTGGAGRTAFGLNALMNNGLLAIRTVIKNLDRKLFKPLGQSMFYWNMQFNVDVPEVRGDMKIVAKGTGLLAQKEIQSQRLISLLQISANPLVAPYVNVSNVLHELAVSLDLNPVNLVNDPAQALLAAQIIGQQGNVNYGTNQEAPQSPPPGGQPGNGGVPPTTDANYNAGGNGGNVGSAVGSSPGATNSIAGA